MRFRPGRHSVFSVGDRHERTGSEAEALILEASSDERLDATACSGSRTVRRRARC
jgi:hypothetical protein